MKPFLIQARRHRPGSTLTVEQSDDEASQAVHMQEPLVQRFASGLRASEVLPGDRMCPVI